jgi:hypothetical protein
LICFASFINFLMIRNTSLSLHFEVTDTRF